MGWEDIFYNETNCVSIDIESIHRVNEEFSLIIPTLKVIASFLILLLVIPAFYKLYDSNITFVNILSILDCLNSAGHIPVLLLNLK